MTELGTTQLILLAFVFSWSGFVRSGIGFGGSALALPLMLLITPDPVFLLPIISIHFVFFSGLTLWSHPGGVDWRYCFYSQLFTIVPAVIGVLGLISLPAEVLTLIVYFITLSYGVVYLLQLKVSGGNKYTDSALLILGGYVSGAALTGAPLLAVVFSRNVALEKLRNSLFIAFFVIVVIKMAAFKITGISWQFKYALLFFPAAAIGHFVGLKAHERILKNNADTLMRMIGLALVVVTLIGISRYYLVAGG